MNFSARTIEVDDFLKAQELYFSNGWTDGLPIVPPTSALVARSLSFTQKKPDEIIGRVPERRRAITVEKVAINAVMAGCRPEYLPVVLAAVEASCSRESNPHGPTGSTGGAGLLLIVNGPPGRKLGFNSGGNVLGQGTRANATVGRALRLVLMNCAGSIPGQADRSTLGHAGKYSWCIAEDESDTRWDPLHVTLGYLPMQGAVTTFWGLSTMQISDHVNADPDAILKSLASKFERAGLHEGKGCQVVVIIAGEHRRTLADAGLGKDDVRDVLFKHRLDDTISRPEDILVVSAGGAGGRFSAISISWGSQHRYLAVTSLVEECVSLDDQKGKGSENG